MERLSAGRSFRVHYGGTDRRTGAACVRCSRRDVSIVTLKPSAGSRRVGIRCGFLGRIWRRQARRPRAHCVPVRNARATGPLRGRTAAGAFGRLGKASERRVAADAAMWMPEEYRRHHRGWNVKHYNERLVARHVRATPEIKPQLQTAGVGSAAKRCGARRSKHARKPCEGHAKFGC